MNTQKKNIDIKTLKETIYYTAEHRESLNILKNWKDVVKEIEESDVMKRQWAKYQKDNFYAEGILFENLIDSLKEIGLKLFIKL